MPSVDYESFWQGFWNDTTRYGPACRHRRRIVAQLVRKLPHNTVLDLGCGDGSLLAELAQKIKARFAGSDISREALRMAQRNVPSAEFFQADLPREELSPDKKYDVVILSEVLEHIRDDEAVLRQLAPIARHVVISVPGGAADRVDRSYGHFRNYDGDLLVKKLQTVGFDVLHFRRWGMPFYELSQRILNEGGAGHAFVDVRYGPWKKLLAHFVYGIFFLNVFPSGSQVFAVGRSKMFKAGG